MHAALAMILSHWRRVTSLLMSHNYDIHWTILHSDPRQRTMRKLLTDFDVVLSHLTSQTHGGTRMQDLEHLVEQGAKFGWLLFSQPTVWTFDWRCGGSSLESLGDRLVVFPALLQLSNPKGRVHKVARTMSDVQIVKSETLCTREELVSSSETV